MPREELRSLVLAMRAHLEWLQAGGVTGLPRGAEGVAAPPAPPTRPAQRPAVTEARPPWREAAPLADSRERPAPSRPMELPLPAVALAPALPMPAPSRAPQVVRYADLPDPLPVLGQEGLDLTRGILGECTRCKLCHGRNSLVFGNGAADTKLVFVGEGPGAEEDRTGLPFVGAAGDLLTRMIAAMGLSRDQVYICNVVKCRPPGNRTPEPDEIAACRPFLRAQIQAIHPQIIVALGRTPAQVLLNTTAPISRIRGKFSSWEGVPVMPTFHPAYLLRTPSAKRQVWEDLQLVMTALKKAALPS